jgi:hypothetical protein
MRLQTEVAPLSPAGFTSLDRDPAADAESLESAAAAIDQLLRIIGMSRGLIQLRLLLSEAQQVLRSFENQNPMPRQPLLPREKTEL